MSCSILATLHKYFEHMMAKILLFINSPQKFLCFFLAFFSFQCVTPSRQFQMQPWFCRFSHHFLTRDFFKVTTTRPKFHYRKWLSLIEGTISVSYLVIGDHWSIQPSGQITTFLKTFSYSGYTWKIVDFIYSEVLKNSSIIRKFYLVSATRFACTKRQRNQTKKYVAQKITQSEIFNFLSLKLCRIVPWTTLKNLHCSKIANISY